MKLFFLYAGVMISCVSVSSTLMGARTENNANIGNYLSPDVKELTISLAKLNAIEKCKKQLTAPKKKKPHSCRKLRFKSGPVKNLLEALQAENQKKQAVVYEEILNFSTGN